MRDSKDASKMSSWEPETHLLMRFLWPGNSAVSKTKRMLWSAVLAVFRTIDPGGDVLSLEAAFIHLKDLILVRQYLQDVRYPGGSTSPFAVAKSIIIASWEHERGDAIV